MAHEGSTDAAGQQRRYRLFMVVESALLFITLLGSMGLRAQHVFVVWVGLVLSGLCMWHIVAIPICVLYLLGKPIVMTLSPLFPSAESRAFYKQLRERPGLGDDEFYARFYEGSGIPRNISARLRCSLLELYPMIDRVIPSDFLHHLDDELDFGDVLYRFEQEFGIHFAKTDLERIDGTFDNLVRLVHVTMNPESRCLASGARREAEPAR